jgi:hypothetical protein
MTIADWCVIAWAVAMILLTLLSLPMRRKP